MNPISVLIVDDHELVRLGLRTLLSRYPQFQVVGEAASGPAAVEMVERLQPRVVLMDVRMPDGSGIDACRAIRDRRPDTRVIMLTSYTDKNAAMAAILAGACGYMLKQVRGSELALAIETVARGGSLVDPALVREVFHHLGDHDGRREGETHLTPQERQVLALVAQGMTNREIARSLFLAEKTVRNYVSNILQKLGLSNRAQAAAYATRQQLLRGADPGDESGC